MARVSPSQFFVQVRAEASKVVWPTRKETMLTTAMVFALTAIVAVFFFIADQVLAFGVQSILQIGMG